MIYYTGDIHGQPFGIARFCKKINLTREDTVVILGDVGANYYGNGRDIRNGNFCTYGLQMEASQHLEVALLYEMR